MVQKSNPINAAVEALENIPRRDKMISLEETD
jgi:hypothetical protein